jgi:hypothetical protein
MAAIIKAQSSADVASGPKLSSDHESGKHAAFVTSPNVGLCPIAPQSEVGIRMEPPVSEPMVIAA